MPNPISPELGPIISVPGSAVTKRASRVSSGIFVHQDYRRFGTNSPIQMATIFAGVADVKAYASNEVKSREWMFEL